LSNCWQKSGESDFLRAVAEAVLQIPMEADVEGLIGAPVMSVASTGSMDIASIVSIHASARFSCGVPSCVRDLTFRRFLSRARLLRRRWSLIQEAWIGGGGVSTRRVDELVQAMGLSGISKSQVSKLCKDIDERVSAFLDRPIDGEWPYLWLDVTYLKVRDVGRIVSVAAIVAVAVTTEGRREIIGLGIGPSEPSRSGRLF
jgi:hypothetical protein